MKKLICTLAALVFLVSSVGVTALAKTGTPDAVSAASQTAKGSAEQRALRAELRAI